MNVSSSLYLKTKTSKILSYNRFNLCASILDYDIKCIVTEGKATNVIETLSILKGYQQLSGQDCLITHLSINPIQDYPASLGASLCLKYCIEGAPEVSPNKSWNVAIFNFYAPLRRRWGYIVLLMSVSLSVDQMVSADYLKYHFITESSYFTCRLAMTIR